MNIKWFNKVTNVKVLQKAKTQSIDTLLTLSQLRWSGHLVRMSDDRLPKQLFYSELSEGHRLRGRPTLRFKDTLKKSLQNCSIATAHWEITASNRHVWKQLTRKGAAAYEQAKRGVHAEKRAATNAGTESRDPLYHVTCVVASVHLNLDSDPIYGCTDEPPTLVLGWTLSFTIVDHIHVHLNCFLLIIVMKYL